MSDEKAQTVGELNMRHRSAPQGIQQTSTAWHALRAVTLCSCSALDLVCETCSKR